MPPSELTALNLNDILHTVAQTAQRSQDGEGIRLTSHLGEQLPAIWGSHVDINNLAHILIDLQDSASRLVTSPPTLSWRQGPSTSAADRLPRATKATQGDTTPAFVSFTIRGAVTDREAAVERCTTAPGVGRTTPPCPQNRSGPRGSIHIEHARRQRASPFRSIFLPGRNIPRSLRFRSPGICPRDPVPRRHERATPDATVIPTRAERRRSERRPLSFPFNCRSAGPPSSWRLAQYEHRWSTLHHS